MEDVQGEANQSLWICCQKHDGRSNGKLLPIGKPKRAMASRPEELWQQHASAGGLNNLRAAPYRIERHGI